MRKVAVMNYKLVKSGAYTIFDMNDAANATDQIKLPFEVGTVNNYKPEGWSVKITQRGTIICNCYQHGKRAIGIKLRPAQGAKVMTYLIQKTYPLPPKPVAPKRFKDYAWLRKLKGKSKERS